MYLAPWWRILASARHPQCQDQRQQRLIWTPAHTCGFQLVLAFPHHTSIFPSWLPALQTPASDAKTYFPTVAAAAAKSLQSCPTLCNHIDGSPPGSPAPGILQARTLEWVAISFSNAWKWKVKRKSLSCVRLFATTWTTAHQAPPSMGFSRQEYWSGVPLPSPSPQLDKAKSL